MSKQTVGELVKSYSRIGLSNKCNIYTRPFVEDIAAMAVCLEEKKKKATVIATFRFFFFEIKF